MTMDAVRIETLPATKSLISTKVPETSDSSKERDDDILFIDDIDEDDEIRLRLSDDEEIEQGSTSGQTESQQTSSQVKGNDSLFDVHSVTSSKETLRLHSKELVGKSNLSQTNTASVSEENKLDKNTVNEISNIDDQESTMSGSEKIPPLMHNSTKYWSNSFDNRWKGINSSRSQQSYSHRNSNDWYNNKYSDKDKYNNRNSLSSHNNHFNKIRSNSNSYNSEPKENWSKKDEVRDSVKLNNSTDSENLNDTNHSIEENGVSDDLQIKKKSSSVTDDKSVIENNIENNFDDKETKNSEIDSNHKEKECIALESELSSSQKCKENDSNSDSSINNKELKSSIKEGMEDMTCNDDGASSTTKDCNVSTTEPKTEKCESKLEKVNKEEESDSSSTVLENKISETNSLDNDADLTTKENAVNSEASNEIQLKIAEVSSNVDDISSNVDDTVEDTSTDLMEVDDINESSLHIDDKNSSQIDTSDNETKSEVNLEENENKNSNEDPQVEEKTDDKESINTDEEKECTIKDSDKKSNEDSDTNENSDTNDDNPNESAMLISEIEIADVELSEGLSGPTTVDDKIDEAMDIDIHDSSSSTSLDGAKVKNYDSNDSKPLACDDNEKNSLKSSSLVVDESPCKEVEKLSTPSDSVESEEVKEKIDTDKSAEEQQKTNVTEISVPEKVAPVIEEVVLLDDELETEFNSNENIANDSTSKADTANDSSLTTKDTSQTVPISTADGDKVDESNKEGRAVVHKRRRRKKINDIMYQEAAANEIQTENGIRQKRRSARNAEEMIRKEILKDDDDYEDSSDESNKFVSTSYKKVQQSSSPPSLKRTLEDIDCISDSVAVKKIKCSADVTLAVTNQQQSEKKDTSPRSKESIAEAVRKISQEDIRGRLKKLKQEELEALLLQKIVECITIRGEMGKLREQARASKRNQEATRAKCQQLQKQVEGFDMVLKRLTFDKTSNGDKYVPPIKINRSVGLQVNFLSDHGIQSLKQVQSLKVNHVNSGGSSNFKQNVATSSPQDNRSLNTSPRKVLKTRSPRRPDMPGLVQTSPGVNVSSTTSNSNVPPNGIVMSKMVDGVTKRTVPLQGPNNVMQILPAGQQTQTVIVNSTVGSTPNRTPTLTIQRTSNPVSNNNKTSDLIDLTDEEDKSKSSVVTPITTAITTRFPRVLQAVPASVALTNSSNIRLVQTGGSQGPQTAIVNNLNGRVAYVMQNDVNGVPTRQLVLSSNSIRPVSSVSTRNISTISYKQVPTLNNGTVRVLTTTTPSTGIQVQRHPAPLPECPLPETNPLWKLPPPAPSLKISKVTTGIVLSWNMTLSDKIAEIVSYQLYAYQEVAGTSPNAALWKKVGDVRALPLPMACTLTQFTEGNNYYFAVRAVDVHSRFGQYSKPGNISL